MTNLSFNQLDKLFRNDEFPSIENDIRGTRFLKLRSMSRKSTMEEFCSENNINLSGLRSKEYFQYVFECSDITESDVDTFISESYRTERSVRLQHENYLIDQLNRLQYFDWGGSFGNSLEKTL